MEPLRDLRRPVFPRWLPVAIVIAAVASTGVAAFAPASPLQSSAIVLPISAVLLLWLAARLGRTGSRAAKLRGGAAVALWFVAVVRGTLEIVPGGPDSWIPGVSTPDAAWIAAAATLLFAQALDLVSGLRRTPDVRWPFFLIPLIVYTSLLPWATQQRPPDGDEPWVLLITHSLVHDLDADLSNNYDRGDSVSILGRQLGPQTGDPVTRSGGQSSRHNVLLPIVLAPFYLLGECAAPSSPCAARPR